MTVNKAYDQLAAIFKKIAILNNTTSLLHWDKAVMMPIGAAKYRAEQLATLKLLTHELINNPKIADLILEAGSNSNLSSWQLANLNLMQNQYDHANAVPAGLIAQYSKTTSDCEMVWRQARAENNFKQLEPSLTEVVSLAKEIAQIKADKFGCSKYDALLDQFDRGRKSAEIDQIFTKLELFLPNFINQVMEKQNKDPKLHDIKASFASDLQKQLNLEIMKILGFDFDHGRLDISHHPFCGGSAGDVRITTKYENNNFIFSLMGVIHETGHALYEQNLPQEHIFQPVGHSCGMSIHESQSLLMEMQIGTCKEFIELIQPLICRILNVQGPEFSSQNIYKLVTRVKPSLIRIAADEVTYPLHVILRYRLEQDLINNQIQVKDLPELWNIHFKEKLNIKVTSDADGCMQDIHWPSGSFGYFPTYSLGAMNAAQIFAAAKQNIPDLMTNISKGNLTMLVDWLKKEIFSKASLNNSSELIKQATGQNLNIEIYQNYLKNKYLI